MLNQVRTAPIHLEESDNDIIEDCIASALNEAVIFFDTPFQRVRGDRSRFFYKQAEVDFIMAHVKHPEWLKVIIIWEDDKRSVFCWELRKIGGKLPIPNKA